MKVRKMLAARMDLRRAVTRLSAFGACLGLFATASAAAEFGYRQVAQDMAIYVGILPTKVAPDRPPAASGGEMHQGTPEWGEQYHVVVTLFDDASGRRITNAEIRASVSNASLPGKRVSGPQKQLEPMLVGSAATYGNYFNMPAPAPYRIELEVLRPGKSDITKASFEYRHALVTTRPRS